MSVLSHFFLASPDHYQLYDGITAYAAESQVKAKSLTPLEVSGIYAALQGKPIDVDLIDEFPLLTPEEAETWIFSVPERMIILLADLSDEQLIAAAEQSALNTAAELGWRPEVFEGLLAQLRLLCQGAEDQGKNVYLWMSL